MKNLNDYCIRILEQYPEAMNKNQFYKLAHISKSTALFLLKSKIIPCHDTGKKTRKYTIKTTDVINYLKDREIHPYFYKAPEGWYTSSKKNTKPKRNAYIPNLTNEQTEKLEDYFKSKMENISDLMETKDFVNFSGYSKGTVLKWCKTKKLKTFNIGGRYIIPKECVVNLFSSPEFYNGIYLSDIYIKYLIEFCNLNDI